MKSLLEFILLHLVKNPDDVVIDEVEVEDQSFEYIIHVNQDDVGRVIGRQGSTIQAIRTLAKVRAMQDGTRVRVTVESGDRPEHSDRNDRRDSRDEMSSQQMSSDEVAPIDMPEQSPMEAAPESMPADEADSENE